MNVSSATWLFIQLVVDVVLVFLILFFLFFQLRERKQRSLLRNWIIRQMKVFSDLVQSSDKKAEVLSNTVETLIKRLRAEIAEAEKALKALEKRVSGGVARETATPRKQPAAEPRRTRSQREAIRYLLKKGMSPLEISRQLDIPIGEVTLVNKLEDSDDRG